MNEYLSYQDVVLFPEYSPYNSRKEAPVSTKFGPREFKLPVVPANMECVIDTKTAKWMSENDYFYIMHRFNKDKTARANTDNWEFLKKANLEKWKTISISLGVQDCDKEFLLNSLGARFRIDYITIDIAHAHSIRMKDMLSFVKSINVIDYPPFIIAGNVATPEAVIDLENWGADAVKVGIAQGNSCSTYGMTGFGVPMFSCMLACDAVAKKPLVADGGIRTNGDIAKAIRSGADMVMAGTAFAACIDAPGETITKQYTTGELTLDCARQRVFEKTYKQYYGSASEYNKGNKSHVEGILLELPCNGMTYAEKLAEITDSYSSSVSYAGGNLRGVKWAVKKS